MPDHRAMFLVLACALFATLPEGDASASPCVTWTAPALVDSSLPSGYADNAVAVDSFGDPHVVYFDYATNDIRYAFRSGDAWGVDTLEHGTGFDTGNNDATPGLVLDRQGRPHAVYTAMRNGQRVVVRAVKTSGTWSTDVVGEPADWCIYPRVALDPRGEPAVVYGRYDGSIWQVVYCEQVAGQWSVQVVDEGDQPVLAFDAGGAPRVAYRGWTGGVFGKQRFAVRSGGSWAVEQLDLTAGWHRVVVDSLGMSHITCKTGSYIYHLTKVDGLWTYTQIGRTITDGHGAPLALNRQGEPVMVFLDQGHFLSWLRRENGAWAQEPIDPDGTQLWANTPALAVDPTGAPWVAYQAAQALRYVKGLDFCLAAVEAPDPAGGVVLSAPTPNPGGGRVSVAFTIPARAHVRLTFHDVQGRVVAGLADGVHDAGRHTLTLDTSGLRAGLYFVRLWVEGTSFTRRVVVVR